jgi:hypothetical protein
MVVSLILLSLPSMGFSQESKASEAKGDGVKTDEAKIDDANTKFDFDEATLDGKMKAPTGMMLKGRVEQNKSQMVQLRKEFRADLKRSSGAVRAIKAKD